MSLSFTVPGEPHAWERAQQSGRRKFNSSEMTAAKKTIAQYADLAIRAQKASLLYPREGNFWLSCDFYIGDKRRANPDIDNLVKLVADALNGVVWHDDRQLVELVAHKVVNQKPSTSVVILDESEVANDA